MAKAAQQAGADAMLVVDMPPEHAAPLRDPAREAGLDWIGLVAPTSTPRRREIVIGASTGFVYAVSLTGVTGTGIVGMHLPGRCYPARMFPLGTTALCPPLARLARPWTAQRGHPG